MADEDKPDEGEEPSPEPGSEEAFFRRMQSLMDASLSDERIGRAFDAWAANLNQEIEDEEVKPKRRAKADEEGGDGEAERVEGADGGGDGAERRRATGGVGPRSRSGYWERFGERFLYGRKARSG